jgi:hypothetical protein
MPAIQLAHLQRQIEKLIGNFESPELMIKDMQNLFEQYSDRAHRPGRSGEPAPLLASYYVPKPIIRHVVIALKMHATSYPEQALILCDAFWETKYLEFKLIAIGLLGAIDTASPDPVFQRSETWASQLSDDFLLNEILVNGLARIREIYLQQYISACFDWMSNPSIRIRRMGLLGITIILKEENFDNLPLLFRLLTPFIHAPPFQLHQDVLAIVRVLAKKAPVETGYFLRQCLALGGKPGAGWFIRQTMREYPPETQNHLRLAMKSSN